MAKVKVNLSLDADTAERLRQLAYDSHKSVSQYVTDYIWVSRERDPANERSSPQPLTEHRRP